MIFTFNKSNKMFYNEQRNFKYVNKVIDLIYIKTNSKYITFLENRIDWNLPCWKHI